MAQESFDYILNLEHRPNKTGVLLAIPMYMYRIETYKLSYGINFFQKAVLMFKTRPGIDNETIANCLGLDKSLIDKITDQLITLRLIGKDGRLTDKGKEMKNDIEGIVVHEDQKSIGYVFQHINDDSLYGYYVNNIRKATVINEQICTGTKGDSGTEDYYTAPIAAKKLLENRVINQAPSQREILSLIRRSNKHAYTSPDAIDIPVDDKPYGIHFIPDNHPTLVWVCTYAYVPRIEEEVYSSEWEVQDPFGFENSTEFKLYVESLLTNGLIEDFTLNFKNLETIEGQTIDAFQAMMDELVNKEMDRTFVLGYQRLDASIQTYLRTIIKNYLLLNRTIEIDVCGAFIGYMQNALETILKIDFEKYAKVYKKLSNSFKYEFRMDRKTRTDFFTPEDRYDYMEELFTCEQVVADYDTMDRMKKFSETFSPDEVKSLKHYLMKFLFAHKYNSNNPLFDIIKGKVGFIYTIAGLRNLSNHGQKSNERQMRKLTSDEIQEYFSELVEIVNNYIIKYHE